MLEYFFRHYDRFVDRYVIFDDGSTDGSLERLRAHPRVDIRRLDHVDPASIINSLRHLYDECWKESRGVADWVIVTNIDEHIHHPANIRLYLKRCRDDGVTCVPALGYQMLSPTFPSSEGLLFEAVSRGAPSHALCKLAVFDPDAIEEVHYGRGRHVARPRGVMHLPRRDELMLLHFKYLGPDFVLDRLRAHRPGLGERDVAEGWGNQFLWTEDDLSRHWRKWSRRLVNVTDPDLAPWDSHPSERWWRRRKSASDQGTRRPAAEPA